jgi:hypothetical protein
MRFICEYPVLVTVGQERGKSTIARHCTAKSSSNLNYNDYVKDGKGSVETAKHWMYHRALPL